MASPIRPSCTFAWTAATRISSSSMPMTRRGGGEAVRLEPRFTLVAALAAVLAAAGCDDTTGPLGRGALPVIQLATIAPITDNVLGAVASAHARRGDSARVFLTLAGEPTSNPYATPSVPLSEDSAMIPVR